MNLQIKKISNCIKLLCLALITIAGSSQLQAQEGEHTSFLLDKSGPAGTQRAMNYLSSGFNSPGGVKRKAIRDAIKANGGNVAYIFLANESDGAPANINPYGSKWANFGLTNLHSDTIKEWRVLIKELIDDGLEPIFWLLADDSDTLTEEGVTRPGSTKPGTTEKKRFISYFKAIVKEFDDIAAGYVIGLEADEYLKRTTVFELANILAGQTTKSIGLHLTDMEPNATDLSKVQYWNLNTNIDTYYHQYGFNKTPAQIKKATEYYLSGIRSSLRFVASEYCLKSDTLTCQALGDAAIAGGAQHTGNGRTPPVIVEPEQKSTFIRYKKYLIPIQ